MQKQDGSCLRNWAKRATLAAMIVFGGIGLPPAEAASQATSDIGSVKAAARVALDLVQRGDFENAAARVKSADGNWDDLVKRSQPLTLRIVNRAIDRSLDRALAALSARPVIASLSERALRDLLVALNSADALGQKASSRP